MSLPIHITFEVGHADDIVKNIMALFQNNDMHVCTCVHMYIHIIVVTLYHTIIIIISLLQAT